VNYNTVDITAKAGSDYVGTSGTLVFDPGVTSKTIRVSLRDDTVSEPTETFGVRLSSPTGGAVIGSSAWAVVTILDNDTP
jgi:endoglucanase